MATPRELLDAVKAGNAERVRELLESDPALASARDDVDIFEASALGSLDRISSLLQKDPGLAGAFSADGFTPLHLAAFFGHSSAARVLLDRGADVNARTDDGRTPLTLARDNGHDVASELLRRRGGVE